jgi:hypothetical protein
MKLTTAHDEATNVLTVQATENCDTDGGPLVRQVFFRNFRSALDPEFGAVAAAVLFGSHCGSIVTFDGAISIDAARAIRRIVADVEELEPVNGTRRDISQGVASVVVGEPRALFGGVKRDHIGKATHVVSWSGDFVEPGQRDSAGYVGGKMFTNALLVAGSTAISSALALLVGGRSTHLIHIPAPALTEETDFTRVSEGLEFIGVKLRALEAA